MNPAAHPRVGTARAAVCSPSSVSPSSSASVSLGLGTSVSPSSSVSVSPSTSASTDVLASEFRPSADVVQAWRDRLGALVADVDGGPRAVALLTALEELKAAASAAQARLAVRIDAARRAAEASEGVPLERRGRGVAVEIGLARAESPHRARSLVGAAKAWLHEMPHTFAALEAGRLSEHRALLLVRETACLPVEVRGEVDRLVCHDPRAMAGLGTRRLVALARSHAARLDPASLAARARRAEGERSVTLRPAPDTMTYLTALLPVAQGVAVLAALRRAADSARASGDPRSRGQVMADTLVERVTGQRTADAVPVAVNLVMSDATLLGAAHDGAVIDGHGPVPAQVARNLVAHGLDAGAAWLRRLYSDPAGDLLATTSSARFHAPGLAALLRVRDQGLCRTPYCDAPARELDHVVPAADGGATDLENGQGLCVACNRAKQAPGWLQRPDPVARDRAGRHTVLTTTPTGHTYRSTAPQPPIPLPLGVQPRLRVQPQLPAQPRLPVEPRLTEEPPLRAEPRLTGEPPLRVEPRLTGASPLRVEPRLPVEPRPPAGRRLPGDPRLPGEPRLADEPRLPEEPRLPATPLGGSRGLPTDDGSSVDRPTTGGVLGSAIGDPASPHGPRLGRRSRSLQMRRARASRARASRREAARRRALADAVAGPSPVDATFQALVDGLRSDAAPD